VKRLAVGNKNQMEKMVSEKISQIAGGFRTTPSNAQVAPAPEGTERINSKEAENHWEEERDAIEKAVGMLMVIPPEEELEEKETKLNKIVGVVIILNVLVFGMEVDLAPGPADNPFENGGAYWFALDTIFLIIFIVELLIRMTWEKWDWIWSWWNWLDFTIVVCALIETFVLTFITGRSSLKMLTVLRIVRLAKLVRVVRLVRMFRSLYVTVMAFKNALSSLMYIALLMIMGLFLCAIFTTSTIGRDAELRDEMMGNNSGNERFGTVPRSMYSLFELMTLEGWVYVGRPLVERQPLYAIFLFLFIMIFTFGLLNMIVAMVVEKTLVQARKMDEFTERELRNVVAHELQQMQYIFEESDTDGSGMISREEFETALRKNARVQERLQNMDIPTDDADMLYSIFDANLSGNLSIEDLMQGCARIRSHNPKLDAFAMRSAVEDIRRGMLTLSKDVNTVQNLIRSPIAVVEPLVTDSSTGKKGAAAEQHRDESTGSGGTIEELQMEVKMLKLANRELVARLDSETQSRAAQHLELMERLEVQAKKQERWQEELSMLLKV